MRALDGPDLFHLSQERPDQPLHTVKVALLDGAVDAASLERWAGERLTGLVPLRARLHRLGRARPAWVDGGTPDLGYHVQHVALRAPGGEPELADLLSDLCGGSLDRDRPLWRLWHITGLASGRDALALQVHHSVADGYASVQLWQALADGAPPPAPLPAPAPRGDIYRMVLAGGAGDLVRFPRQLRRFVQHLRRTEAVATKPFVGPPTRFNRTTEGRRCCTFVTLSLPALKAVGAATGATLTEVFATACAGAIRRHLTELGEPPGCDLTATVPAALPQRTDTFGNSVSTLYVSLHSEVVEPDARLDAVRRSFAVARASLDADPRLLPDWQRYPRLNAGVVRLMGMAERRRGRPAYNVIVSSVRGPEPFRLAGVRVVALRSIGPLTGRFGLNLTGWSYGSDFTVGIHARASAADRLGRLGELIADELAHLERRTALLSKGAPT